MPDLYQFATPPVAPDGCDSEVRRGRSDRKMHAGWHAGLDAARRATGWCLRFGYSLLGITNHPATAEATGLK